MQLIFGGAIFGFGFRMQNRRHQLEKGGFAQGNILPPPQLGRKYFIYQFLADMAGIRRQPAVAGSLSCGERLQ